MAAVSSQKGDTHVLMTRHTIPLVIFGIGFIAGQGISIFSGARTRFSLLDISVSILLLWIAFRRSSAPRYIPALSFPILIFAAWWLVSLAWNSRGLPSYVVGIGVVYVFRWLLYAALYWASAERGMYPSRLWHVTLIVSGVGIAFTGIVQYFLYPDLRNLYYLGWDPHFQRLFGTLLDPNFTGIILVGTLLLLLHRITEDKLRFFTGVGLLVVISALGLTYSRSSFVALVVGLVVWGVVSGRRRVMAGVAIAMAAFIFLLPHSGEGRNLFRTVSSYARVGSSERAVSLIREKPLVGHGVTVLPIDASIPSRTGSGVDTSMLYVGVLTGLIGLAVYVNLIVRMYRLGWQALTKDQKNRPVVAVYVGTLSAILVHSIFVNSLFYPWVMVWMWISTGSLEQVVKSEKKPALLHKRK